MRVLLIACALLLGACDTSAMKPTQAKARQVNPLGMAGFDEASVAEAIRGKLLARTVSMSAIHPPTPCTEAFDIGPVRITDRRVSGDEAQIEATYQLRAKMVLSSTSTMANGCYGNLPDGWYVGETADGKELYRVERWQSGWKLAERIR